MANYSAIKAAVNAYIKANGKKEITGRILNSVLNATIDSLGKEFQFGGVLTPADDPGQPDQNVAYIGAAGTYSNFDNLVIESGNIGIFLWNGDWSFETIPVGKDYDNDIQSLTNGLQELSENIQELSDNVIHLDGINEEDLSIPEGDKLQFANRAYNAQQPNGMGYVILRKNKTFAEQVTEENTIYEIRYEFDLDGDEVTIPAGCVLKFVGGAIDNGEIVGTDSTIDAPVNKIFGSDVTIGGTWANPYAYADWFDSIQKAIDAFLVIKLSPRSYDLDEGLELRAFSRIIGADSKLNFSIGNNGVAIKMGSQSRVENVYLRIVRGVGTDRVGVLIDADYMATTRSNSSGYYSTIRRVPQLYMLENVEIENPEYTNTGAFADTAISVRATNTGFWGNIARNVRIFGSFLYGIDIDSNAGSLSSDSGWLTNLTFRDFIFANALVGVNIHKTNASASLSRLTRTLFDNFHFQAADVTKRNEYKELGIVSRFATIDSAEGVTFTNWYVSDWANDKSVACSSTALIHINPNTAIRISVDTSLWDVDHLLDIFRMVSWSALDSGSYYNCPQIDITNTEFALNMSNYIDFDNETTNRIMFLVEILPPMRYYVPKVKISSFITALGLSGLKANPQLLSVEIVPSSLRRGIIVYGHYDVAPSSGEFTTAKATIPARRNEGDYSNVRTRWVYSE